MRFTLKEKTPQEIEKEKAEDKFWADRVKGMPDDICPLQLITSSGKVIEVWDMAEKDILTLIEANLMEELKDHERLVWTHKIINCWKEKHGKISVDMIEGFFALKDKYPKLASHIADFQGGMGMEDIAFATRTAHYLNGMTGGKKEITNENIIKILRNEQQLLEKEKEKSANQ